MSKRYSIAEARNQLPAIVHDAEKGKPVELTRRGKPVAVLMSFSDYEKLARMRPDFWSSLQAFRERSDLTDLDVDAIFAGVTENARDFEPFAGVTVESWRR
jgi:prevent-host-death family protein